MERRQNKKNIYKYHLKSPSVFHFNSQRDMKSRYLFAL